MMLRKKNTLFILIILLSSMLISPQIPINVRNMNERFNNNTDIGIVADLTDEVIKIGVDEYLSSINGIRNIKYLDFNDFNTFEGILIIYGHGDSSGIKLSENNLYSWNNFAPKLMQSNSEKIILVSCFGSSIYSIIGETDKVIAWEGYQDSTLLSNAAAFLTMDLLGEMTKPIFISAIQKAISRMMGILNGEITPDFLWARYRRENTGSWATTARIFWVSMSQDTGDDYALSTNAMIGFIALLRNAALLSPAVAAALAAAFLVNMIFMVASSYNRINHDYLFGAQGYKYLVTLKFVYDLGDDNYRLNGRIYIPIIGTILGTGLYFGIGHVSTSWTYFAA